MDGECDGVRSSASGLVPTAVRSPQSGWPYRAVGVVHLIGCAVPGRSGLLDQVGACSSLRSWLVGLASSERSLSVRSSTPCVSCISAKNCCCRMARRAAVRRRASARGRCLAGCPGSRRRCVRWEPSARALCRRRGPGSAREVVVEWEVLDDAFSVFDRCDEDVAALDVKVGQERDVVVISVDDELSSRRLTGGDATHEAVTAS